MEDATEKFLEIKEDVFRNLAILQFNLDRCQDAGMIDKDSILYNKIDDLIEEVKVTDTYEELEEFVTQAKTIETQIDGYLVSQGQTTISLSWPTFE